MEEVYTLTGSTARPPVPKGSLRITDAQGRLVCDLNDAASSSSSSSAPSTTPAAPPDATPGRGRGNRAVERPEARGYWGKLVLHQVRAGLRVVGRVGQKEERAHLALCVAECACIGPTEERASAAWKARTHRPREHDLNPRTHPHPVRCRGG